MTSVPFEELSDEAKIMALEEFVVDIYRQIDNLNDKIEVNRDHIMDCESWIQTDDVKQKQNLVGRVSKLEDTVNSLDAETSRIDRQMFSVQNEFRNRATGAQHAKTQTAELPRCCMDE